LSHFATPSFWSAYEALPEAVRALADSNFQLLKVNPQYPSLHFKRVGRFWSVRVGLDYRALGRDVPDGIAWFWIGTHADYDQLIGD
jgi:hypothetical protein